jgi:hypothetical protein
MKKFSKGGKKSKGHAHGEEGAEQQEQDGEQPGADEGI